ncbi:MAG: UDP-N-acetylmuramate dehydrogenase [Pseudomonadota bacterium]
MIIETNVALQPHNSFGIAAKAERLLRLRSPEDLQAFLQSPLRLEPHFVLGGGSNIVITGDIKPLVIKIELLGRQLIAEDDKAWVVQAAAGENWHDFVAWTLDQGWPGLENLAMIPGSVGASPVQNVGAYGVELQDRFESLDAVDLQTGQSFTLNAAQCAFGYRDSVFKHAAADNRDLGLLGRALITQVRFRLPKKWQCDVSYLDLTKKQAQHGVAQPTPQQVFDWVCEIRRAKLPDPEHLGSAGSFFKNPTVSAEQCADIIAREPKVVHYHLVDGRIKLAAGWLIDACGWRGKSVGNAAVYERQALVIVNKGGRANPCTGGEVMTLAKAIQTSVYERFGIRLEPEPVVV